MYLKIERRQSRFCVPGIIFHLSILTGFHIFEFVVHYIEYVPADNLVVASASFFALMREALLSFNPAAFIGIY